MKSVFNTTDKIVPELKAENIAKYALSASKKEKKEFNLDGESFTLLRTTFDNNVSVTVFDGTKCGSVVGNDISDEGIRNLVKSAIDAARSAEDDPAKDIAPSEGEQTFKQGNTEPDTDKFFERIDELKKDLKEKYPKIKLTSLYGDYTKVLAVYKNSNGSVFESTEGAYTVTIECAGNDGERTTGLNFTWIQTKDLDRPFIEHPSIRQVLDDTVAQLDQVQFSGKFEGTVVFTPFCMQQLLYMIYANFISSGVLLTGVSIWKDKLGEKVADERLSIVADPFDDRIVLGERYTGDGFLSEKVPIIENGILKTFFLDLYTANKLGKQPTKNSQMQIVVAGGDKSLDEIVSSIDKGLIVGSFSGGSPGANGEFSGVAKSSFLIENGKITGAVSETMINGNLSEMLQHLNAISKETLCNGESVMPYMAFDGITVSGK